MKKLMTILLAILMVTFTSVSVWAVSFDFGGSFKLTDVDNDGFSETLDLDQSILGKTFITSMVPGADAVLDAGSYVEFSIFKLDPTSFVSGVSYDFTNNPYVNGFVVRNSSGTELMNADISLDPVVISGGTASINSGFSMNLTNIDLLVAGSDILDAFVAPGIPGGALNLTINIASANMISMIESANGGMGSFSGSAAPVPEPGTILLLGAGLAGLAVVRRKTRKS